MSNSETHVVVTLREIAEAHGIGVEAARTKAKRRANKGRWQIIEGNHPSDPIRVSMPTEDLQGRSVTPNNGPLSLEITDNPSQTSSNTLQYGSPVTIEMMVKMLESLTDRVAELTDNAMESAKAQGEAEKDAALAKAELEHLRERMSYQEKAHQSEVQRLQSLATGEAERVRRELAELVGDRDNLAEKLTAAELRARRWWHRLAG
ncbi:hypothetical protein [Aurantimonas coralicida]|uniref:hypothetical protein n=1 Tax=Aurantimonas coralicida TaxID=182270 RepID=UPI000462E021|nr:hypothetical protein [Aurantimonas coralicida]MCW7546324.1 hypothetical protein [Aurantimonas litoralis]